MVKEYDILAGRRHRISDKPYKSWTPNKYKAGAPEDLPTHLKEEGVEASARFYKVHRDTILRWVDELQIPPEEIKSRIRGTWKR